MVIGKGSATTQLNESQIAELCLEAFAQKDFTNKRILVIIPDHSRSAPIDIMFRVVYQLLTNNQGSTPLQTLDFMVALGTHPPMSEEAIYHRVGIIKEEHSTKYPKARFFNHEWKNPGQLRTIGTIAETEVAEITGGLMCQEVAITINKKVFDYDVLMIIGPTFPHEVMGFSGGNKYLFPGIAGQGIIDMFHWLGALITNPLINGTKNTPVREVVNRAAFFLPMERFCLSLVVRGNDLAGLYIGTPEEAFSAAADLSQKVHIQYKEQPFKQVLSCAPKMYDDLWTGGKCMYKLEPAVADGGELIICAPHISEVSVTHGEVIKQIGYHVKDYFVKQMEKFKDIPAGVMAHSTHVKGIGSYTNGVELPRIKVTLATQIPEAECRKINLGYRDPATINIDEWKNREDEGILLVEKAGEILYKLKK